MKTLQQSAVLLTAVAATFLLAGCGAKPVNPVNPVNVDTSLTGSTREATGNAIPDTATTVQNTGTAKPEAEKPASTPPVPTENTATGTTVKTPEPTKVKGYTLAQVQEHSSEASCRAIVGSSVYDLSAWINQHPGGDRNILRMCGKDGTSMYEGQHGGQAQVQQVLAEFKIGAYAR